MSENTVSHLKIGIMKNPFGDKRTYHTNKRLTRMNMRFIFPLQFPIIGFDDLGTIGKDILNRISEIDGIVEATINLYEIKIEKGKMFDWDKMDEEIVLMLAKVFSDPDPEVSYDLAYRDEDETKTE